MGGTVKPAECKQPPTPCWQCLLKSSVCIASPVLRQSIRRFVHLPLALMCRIPSISSARYPPPDLWKWKGTFYMCDSFLGVRAISCRWSLFAGTWSTRQVQQDCPFIWFPFTRSRRFMGKALISLQGKADKKFQEGKKCHSALSSSSAETIPCSGTHQPLLQYKTVRTSGVYSSL